MNTRAVLLALVASVIIGLPAHAVDSGPPLLTPEWKLADAISCPAHIEHKVVLLVHGTSVTADENWSWNYSLALPHLGFDVCTVVMPDRLLGDIQESAEYVVYAIRTISDRVGAKIDVIGLSQGALQPRWAVKWWPDIRYRIDDYISMAGTNHGALFADADCPYSCPPSLWQQRTTARFLAALNAGNESPGEISYTSVYSLTDEVVQPTLPKPAAAIAGASNIAVQDVCPGRYVGHVQSMADAVYYGVVVDALTHVGPADPSRVDRMYCLQTFMPYVDAGTAALRIADVYLTASIVQSQHERTTSEPPLRSYVTS